LAALHLGTTVQNLRQAMRQETPTLNGAGI